MAYRFKHGDRPLEDYTIQRGVGRGGFGEVYYAVSDGGREVALKYLRDNPDIELRGVSACMNLKSPHLVMVFDVKKDAQGEYFIVMEYVSGPSLRDLLLAEPNGLGPQKAAYFLREIARGLGYLHDRGIVHRDLKPGNIFYEDGYVKIGDYGLSKFISISRHSAQTTSVGTVHYMAPEVGSGNYSRGIDIYALGVILYEMLLGKVPFEGSSMGEVLMKHLTAQPEVDELPHPFGQVIRKALAKDPNDRYQTVEEMVEALLDVDDLKRSVAGFNPTSLSAAARRVAGDLADSPIPSPNPVRPPYGAPAAEPPAEWVGHRPEVLTNRLTQRFDRVSRKLDKRLRKLGGGRHRPMGAPGRPAQVAPGGQPAAGAAAIGRGERVQRVVLSGIMALGIATGIGLLVGSSAGDCIGLAAGTSSFLLVAAISTGVLLARWLLTAKLTAANPAWVQRLVLGGCCLPLMALASAPALAERQGQGGAALGALLIAVLIARWDDRLQKGAAGELCFRSAIGLGILALVLGLVFQAEEFALMAGGVAAAASLSVQALGWAWPPRGMAVGAVAARRRGHRSWHAQAHLPVSPSSPVPQPFPTAGEPEPSTSADGLGTAPDAIPTGIPVQERLRGVGRASNTPLPPLRSGFARAFWSVAAFLLAGGMIALFVLPLAVDFTTRSYRDYNKYVTDYDTYFGLISGCAACFSFLLFALSKTTQRKRPGFWRETLRPFLIAASMTGLGLSITALAMPTLAQSGGEFGGVVFAVVYSSVLFLVLLILRGKRSRPAYVVGEYTPPPQPPVAVPVGQEVPRVADAPQADAE